MKFERNLGNWLREWVRRPRKVFVDELSRLDEAVERGLVAEAEVSQLAWSDAVVRAQDASTQDEVILSVELSTTVNEDDVEHASARAAVLRRAGYDRRGFVAGHSISTRARELAEATGTTVVLIRPDPCSSRISDEKRASLSGGPFLCCPAADATRRHRRS